MKQLIILCILIMPTKIFAQYASEYNSGMVVKFDDHGQKYLRLILFGQTWFQDLEGSAPQDGFSIKRARVLSYAQVNDRFMMLVHFGANGIYDQDMATMGKNTSVTFFLHEMFVQYKIWPQLYIGAGIHNASGLSRANGQGSINMLTLDNSRADWSCLGLSDQATNHLGIYLKGNTKKWNYRLAWSDAIVNTLDGNHTTLLEEGEAKYLGKALTQKGKYTYSGHVEYQFLDQESNHLSYRVGTYLGTKKVLNLGGGFFHHPNAIVRKEENKLLHDNAQHFALDLFYDSPLGKKKKYALTLYSKYQFSKMGEQYVFQNLVGSGHQLSGHLGFLLPKFQNKSVGHPLRNRLQPYVGYSYRNFKALPTSVQEIRLGANWYLDGHNARITAEYQRSLQSNKTMHQFTLQAMVLL